MNRRHFLSMLPLLVGGCASGAATRSRGESATWAFFNPSHVNSYPMAWIDSGTGWSNLGYDMGAILTDCSGRSGGGPLHAVELGHRVPESAQVFWRLMPRADQEPYRVDRVGPFEIAIRSQIPPEVLLAATEPRHVLQIAVSVGVVPVRLRWRLIGPRKDGQGHRQISRGGDWSPLALGE
jgi:hypothetical protein